MEQWLMEALKTGSSFILLGIVIWIMLCQQEKREERAAVERKEMLDTFQSANDKLIEQVHQQIDAIAQHLATLSVSLTSAIGKMHEDHGAIHRAHDHQRDEHKEILRLLQGGKEK